MKYKVGDKVRVRKDLNEGMTYNEFSVTTPMADKAGDIVTISAVSRRYYHIAEYGCCWTDEMFEGLAEDELTAEEAIKILGEICCENELCDGCPIGEAKWKMKCQNFQRDKTEEVLEILKQWKKDHEKKPIKTIDTSNRYGLVTAFITKYYKTGIGQRCDEPLHTITTSPGHFGLVSAFLIKYYGGGCGQTLDRPLDTITTKDRFGLVNVILDIKGEKYIISDIFLRMLKPEELKLMQGFPKDYIIDRDYNWKKYPIAKQVARIGNSVVPIMAEKLVEANCPYLKVGERMPNMSIDDSQEQLRFA